MVQRTVVWTHSSFAILGPFAVQATVVWTGGLWGYHGPIGVKPTIVWTHSSLHYLGPSGLNPQQCERVRVWRYLGPSYSRRFWPGNPKALNPKSRGGGGDRVCVNKMHTQFCNLCCSRSRRFKGNVVRILGFTTMEASSADWVVRALRQGFLWEVRAGGRWYGRGAGERLVWRSSTCTSGASSSSSYAGGAAA
jgi:hypothetical protein